jgi:penicillin-binding protein 1A
MKFRTLLLIGLALPVVALAVAGTAVLAGFQVANQRVPDETFTREGIRKILARESVVYYSDGKTRVGTFFEGTHRDYVPFDSIPRPLVDALVSAEDRNYWKHGGWDVTAFAGAMADNLKSSGRWRGGSTLTQQTAKNLFGRTGPLRGKVDELINAYRLERHFSKEEILEFYLNQFFVVGNGHGVRIAARYFFDKEPRELSLVECAFIAGSVKGPNQYNPFIQSTPEKKQAALEKGRHRVAYVLKQMRGQDKITEDQYRKALARKLEFKRGDFRFRLSTNMVKVKQLLDSPEMQEILERHGVEDYTDAGLQITTTLDRDVQRAAEFSVYSNLWKLDLLMRGYQPPRDSVSILSHFEPGDFVTGRVEELVLRDGAPFALRVRFGALEGTVQQRALQEFFRYWNRNLTGANALPSPAAMTGFANIHLRRGARVTISVPYRTPGELRWGGKIDQLLELAQKPVLQGAAQVMQEGRVIANVGGFGNSGYDRVNQARRQFGSAFKPLVYAAALELGWQALDPLPNFRQAFQMGNLIYFPKPDHPPEDTVSLAWAGRRSENIASVYLLYHLFDKTDFSGFWENCRALGIDPDNFRTPELFEIFVRDSLGIVIDNERLRELRFRKAVEDFAIDLTFDGSAREAELLRRLSYGVGFAAERERYVRDPAGPHDPENALRIRILSRDYLDYAANAAEWRRGRGEGWTAARHETGGWIGIFKTSPGRGWRPVPLQEAREAGEGSLLMEGEISLETLRKLEERLRFAEEPGDRYTRENLYASRDFRAQAALRYMAAFSRKLDIASPLDRVMSFPLGVNVITLGEAVNAYQAFQQGARYRTRFGRPQLYIEKIATQDGRVIFEDYAEREEILADRTRFMLESILASVVRGGTGQRIGRELTMPLGKGGPRVAVPAYGKTGTTNDYRNAAFLGYIAAPKGQGKGFDPTSGYAIGVYTGFDDNKPVDHRGFRGTGASTAIPAWLGIAQNIVKLKKFQERIAIPAEGEETGAVITEAPIFQREQYKHYTVSRRTGLPAEGAAEAGYVEDLSDELGPGSAGGADNTGESASLWIRED